MIDPRRVSAWVKKRVTSMEKALMVEAQLQHYQAQLSIDEVKERSDMLARSQDQLAAWRARWRASVEMISQQQTDVDRLAAELDEACQGMDVEELEWRTKADLMAQREQQDKAAHEFCVAVGHLQHVVQSVIPNRDLFEMGNLMHGQFRQALTQVLNMTKQAEQLFESAVKAQHDFESAQASNIGVDLANLPPVGDSDCMVIDPPPSEASTCGSGGGEGGSRPTAPAPATATAMTNGSTGLLPPAQGNGSTNNSNNSSDRVGKGVHAAPPMRAPSPVAVDGRPSQQHPGGEIRPRLPSPVHPAVTAASAWQWAQLQHQRQQQIQHQQHPQYAPAAPVQMGHKRPRPSDNGVERVL